MAQPNAQRKTLESKNTTRPTRRPRRVTRESRRKPAARAEAPAIPVAPRETTAVNQVCAELNWLVSQEARRIARRLPYHAELDELIGAGSLGLVCAVQKHFERPRPILQRFAQLRIRGAILDHLRANDHLTRRQRAAVVELRRATEELERRNEEPELESLARAMGMSQDRVTKIKHQLAAVQVTHLEDSERVESAFATPDQVLLRDDMRASVVKALGNLPEKLTTLLSLYYYEGLSYREIGDILGVTDSRVCQLHSQALNMLRKKLNHVWVD
ncbi:MAG: sigma-70 family RNA polymerase sigma factor [Myxococcota bacterium]